MSDENSAIIIDSSKKKLLVSLIRTEFNIKRVKTYTCVEDALEEIPEYADITFIFIHFETSRDKTFDFVANVKQMENCAQTKFILLSDTSDKRFLMKAASNGISAFILKPFTKEKFVDKVRKLLPRTKKPKESRFDFLENVEARLRFKGKEIRGGIENIGANGCLVRTPKLGKLGIEIYDVVTIRIDFEKERLGINAEVIKMEKAQQDDYPAVRSTLKFTDPDKDNALQFAKFWAYILRERDKET